MKKLLLLALVSLMAMPAMAATIYASEDGDNKVDIYGNLRAHIGYGFYNGGSTNVTIPGLASTTYSGKANNQFNYALQGNSRLGVTVKLGAFTGQVEFGANEQTLTSSPKGTIGLRQAWASYAIAGQANKYGSLSFGKMDTPTSMGGYITSGWDSDKSLIGYGGSITSMRRFQLQYAIKGFQIALIEKEAGMRDVSVRPAIAYNFTGNGLKGKVGFTGALVTEEGNNNVNIPAAGLTFGIKKQFNDFFALSFIARVGLNENRYGEAGDRWDDGTFTALNENTDGLRAGAAFEFTLSPIKLLDINIGIGYQSSLDIGKLTPNRNIIIMSWGIPLGAALSILSQSVAAYVRLPIKLDAHWHLIPEVGTHINFDYYKVIFLGSSINGSSIAASFYAMLQLVSIF